MRYILSSQANVPITLEVAKGWLEVTHNYHDQQITEILEAAFSFSEEYTGMSFREQVWSLAASAAELGNGVIITKTPLTELTGIEVLTPGGDKKTLTEEQYYLTVEETRAFLAVTDLSVLTSASSRFNAITASFKTNGGLPPHVRNAVKMMVAFFYENRGDAPTINNNSAPPEALKLLQLERVLFA